MNTRSKPAGVSRRAMLKTGAAAAIGAMLPSVLPGQTPGRETWKAKVLNYLESLAVADGGYAWHPDARPHITPTFAVIGCYHVLEQSPPAPSGLAGFVRTHHPSRMKKLEQEHRYFEFQQIQSLVWLGEDASSFRDQVRTWRAPRVYLKQYEQHGWPILRHELTAFTCRALLGMPLDELAAEYVSYLELRRRPNGSFNNTPAAAGGDGHVMNTWWGLEALRVLGREDEMKRETVEWLSACQLPDGSFTWKPRPEFAAKGDLAYTWAALRGLHLLGAAAANRRGCIDFIRSTANADGGFGDRPGWFSNPMATLYALESLRIIGALDSLAAQRKPARARKLSLPRNLQVYSIQIEAHGQGSPTEAVDLAGSLGIHLWGAKNASTRWMATAREIARRKNVLVQFFVANEEYGTWVDVPGFGTYSHTSDVIAPAASDFGSSLAKAGVVTWEEFRRRRLAALLSAGGRLIWQFGENEELVRLFLDDSLERGGYAAISTFHFGNPDFTNTEPFLQRYRGRIPFIALQDAHGVEPWWFSDMTTGFRTLFLAIEPTWDGWLRALENNWVAAVRRDAVSGEQLWLHAGDPEVSAFVRRHELSWRWWDNEQIRRPLVSLVAVRPQDEFETARPESGVTLRVRCAWENTTQGQPRKPIAEFGSLTVDGVEVRPELERVPSPAGGGLRDYYHYFHIPAPAPGEHTATVTARTLQTGVQVTRTIRFTCPPA